MHRLLGQSARPGAGDEHLNAEKERDGEQQPVGVELEAK
jgi:hypothetical protein